MKTFNRSACKATSWLLLFATLVGLFQYVTFPVLSTEAEAETPYVLLDGETVSEVVLDEEAKLRFEAVSPSGASSYRWQIKDPASADRWINISDGYSKYLWVTHALVGSMLRFDGTAQLRCRVEVDSKELFTEPVKVILSLNVDDEAPQEPVHVVNNQIFNLDNGDTNHTTYSIVINYLFDNNAIAFEPYGASVAAGSDFKASIKSPAVMGYAPFRRVGNDYIDASYVEFDLKNINADVTINVIYEPALVEYSVHHHLQNVHDDEYSLSYDYITTGKALTGSLVGDGLAFTEEELPGFRALAYEKLTVAADGSTVIEIRYDRNYYLVDFDMDGGYGTEPVYTRYGAKVGANVPVRHGYVFDGWELVSYGGQTPTTEQKAVYDLQTGATISVPAANLSYKARWITQETTYTMVFWCENADDSGYSYWGYIDGLSAMSGTYVDGRDLIGQVDGITDEQYFTFNPAKTDKHVLVEGDGSSIVNVYYTRNYYTLTFKAPGKCTIPTGHTHTSSCYEILCDEEEHIHGTDCKRILECPIEEHTAHTDACLICGKVEHVHGQVNCSCTVEEHTHTTSCWNNVSSVQSNLNNAPRNPQQGQIYRTGSWFSYTYYIYINGRWYRYTGRNVSNGDVVDPSCNKDEHTHGGDGCSCTVTSEHVHSTECYKDTLHTHTQNCYGYDCGKLAHTHGDDCKRIVCGIQQNHSHSSNCNNSSKTNVVKTVYAKYGQTLKNIWPITDGNGKTYNSGERWDPSDSSYYNEVLVYIQQMPPDDFTLTLNTANYKTYTMQYYMQVLPGHESDNGVVEYNGKYYKLDNTIVAIYNFITEAEDFFNISGFEQAGSSPSFGSNGQISTSGNSLTVKFYYDRSNYKLEFNSNGTVLDLKTVQNVKFDEPLKQYNFEPPYPDTLEPNAYTFGGWYTSPGCFPGTEVNWDTLTCPAGNLMLYAKWAPITHKVRVFKDDTLNEQIGAEQIVDHKAFATAPAGNVTNGVYVFQGWFYKDEVNGEIVEKAFAFSGIPVLDDMDIYAKWSSHISVEYKIYYKLFNTDIQIADPTVGSAIAGHNKTFDAKTEDQLYAGYRQGYFPLVSSHTITMSADGTHEFTFYYVYVEAMPYKVQYINKTTGEKVFEDKIVQNNTLSVVTETFKRAEKMMPDAYQKRLVLSADTTDADKDGIYDANVITFYYSADDEHAYYRVVHYIENISGDSYREYRSEETVGLIGSSYTINALTLTGFKFNGTKTEINDVITPITGTTVTTTIGADGVLIELYYDRLNYDYIVKYLESGTETELAPQKTGSGVFGEQIVEYALNLEGKGYELVSDNVKTATIAADSALNVFEFYYQERNVSLKYEVVGPAGCGMLSQYSENLTAVNGQPNGSMPTAYKGFVFLGWFTDKDCTTPVNSSWINQNTGAILPQKQGSVWTSSTYYAKFSALETELTLTTKSTASIDVNQVFIFNVKGKEGTDTAGIDLMVTIVGNGSVTVTELPVGEYTVTELTDWSWRYENGSAKREVTLEYTDGVNELIFDNSREHGKWLDGNDVKNNLFGS